MTAPGTAALRATLLPGALLLAAACGGGDDAGGADPGREAAAAAPETAVAGSDADVSTEAPAGDSARPLRAFRLRLRNRSADTLEVVADADADARTLDTLPPSDSSEVRVETRARRLEVRARGVGGVAGSAGAPASSLYDLERPVSDTLLEFEVPPPPVSDTTD